MAAVVLVRRDVMVDGWRVIRGLESLALKQATRFGLGVLRSNATAKMVNIKDSL